MTVPSPEIIARVNLELKARDLHPAQTLTAIERVGVEDHGVRHQRDTYFAVPSGRLKLREEHDRAEVIHYLRADVPGPASSSYRRLRVPDPLEAREVLATHLGVTVEVVKRRRVLLKDNVRIHLDVVRGLGDFVELEAVAPPGTRPEDQLGEINALRRVLAIGDDRLVERSYADLLAEMQASG